MMAASACAMNTGGRPRLGFSETVSVFVAVISTTYISGGRGYCLSVCPARYRRGSAWRVRSMGLTPPGSASVDGRVRSISRVPWVTPASRSDAAGSIRIPSHCTGATGWKPSWGAVSVVGALPLAPFLDCLGLLARSAADLAPAAAVLAADAAPQRAIESVVVLADALRRLIESPSAVSGQLSLDDIRVLPLLRSVAVVKGLRFPQKVREYFETMMSRIGHQPLPAA